MTADEVGIASATDADWPAIWSVLEPVFRAGETYAVATDVDEAAARALWLEEPRETIVATSAEGTLLGTYYLRPNKPGFGDHVCNCGYVVAEAARGRGLAQRLCVDSQERARALGFTAMQFNFVIASNTGAIRIWRRCGFEIVGTAPGAYRHPRLGLTDAHVMFKTLG